MEEGTRILSTMDDKLITVSESSIRRNLKLNDEAGIRQFSHQWKYLIHTIMECLSPKSTGFNEFNRNIATALVCLATNRVYNFSKMIFDDEPASPFGNDSQGKACPTNSGFEADSAPRVTSLAADEGNVRGKDKGDVEQSGDDASIKGRRLDEGEEVAERVSDDTEEMVTVLTSMDAASILTSGGVQVVPTAADVATATVSIPTGSGVVSTASPTIPTAAPIFTTATESTPYTRRKVKETMVESETPKQKKIARDAEIARIHAEEELQMMINTLDRSNETVVKYLQEYEQIPKDLSIRERIELISNLVKYQENYAQVLKYQTLQRKPRSKKQKKDYYMAIEDFIPMGLKEETERFKRKGLRLKQVSAKKLKTSEEVPEEVKSSEEVPEEKVKEMMQQVPVKEIYVEALQVKHPIIDWKHFDREDLNQLWALVKESLRNRPATSDKEKELWVELKRLFKPDVEDYLWTHTQNLMHPPLEWKLYDTYGVHHVSTRDQDIFMLIEKDYPLRKGIPTGSDEFPLPEQLPTANEDKFPLWIQSDATVEELCATAEVKE
nr:synaptobrevin, longin-like domain protein [Tanacetum cinerariifolium]